MPRVAALPEGDHRDDLLFPVDRDTRRLVAEEFRVSIGVADD